MIREDNIFHEDVVSTEVDYYFTTLGMKAIYFKMFNAEQIANHVHSFIAAKKMAAMSGAEIDHLQFQVEQDDGAMYICPATFEDDQIVGEKLKNFLKRTKKDGSGYSLSNFVSKGPCLQGGTIRLSLYVIKWSPFCNPSTPYVMKEDVKLQDVCTEYFRQSKLSHVLDRYSEMVSKTHASLTPTFEIYSSVESGKETSVITMAFKQLAYCYVPEFNIIFNKIGLVPDKVFVETFSAGVTVYSFYVKNLTDELIAELKENVMLLGVINTSDSRLLRLLSDRILTAPQTMYCKSATNFAYYFMNTRQHSDEYRQLTEALADDHVNLGRVNGLRDKLRRENMAEGRILECIETHGDLVVDIFNDFQRHLKGLHGVGEVNQEITKRINRTVHSDVEKRILCSFLTFNAAVLKTNFSKWPSAAISFRLDPKVVLGNSDLPAIPFGLFMVMGSSFRGFHCRFKDIARGGIRIIRSDSLQAYQENAQSLFDEVYGLALTQQMKNKDIPEGGSKGTILLDADFDGSEEIAFMKYVNSLLDLILEDRVGIPDRYGKPELLFLGPDERTADLMQAAALHSKSRGWKYWKGFTTGKPASLGGIPHDVYGMTTQSVRAYQMGIIEKLGLKEEEVTKVQTGGPDGDLGSNECIMAKDKTIAIVDGAGVVYDPAGLDRQELIRLAHLRSTIDNFDVEKLGEGGFKVLVHEKDITLPNGFHVDDGVVFRNQFPLLPFVEADFLVPCGGRPEAINISNLSTITHVGGEPKLKYKYIVEGANLFVTEDARIALDEAGCVLFKDASSNKGGVTSSSFEVLAALSMTDEEFKEHMQVTDKVPAFYAKYVEQIQEKVRGNARKEFELLWREGGKGVARCSLTNTLSNKINGLNDYIQSNAEMFEDRKLVEAVLRSSLPSILVETIGLEQIMNRVPEAYLRAILSANIASGYVYHSGLRASEFGFYEYMQTFEKEAAGEINNA